MVDRRILLAEAIGTGFLLAVIVGSGWAVEQLGAPAATQLFIHGVIVGAGLAVAIVMFLPFSGAQFNPAVTVALVARGRLDVRTAGQVVVAQMLGGFAGVVIANLTFASQIVSISSTARKGAERFGGEVFATFGLVLLILVLVETRREAAIPVAVGAWVTTIIVATVSTGFANPVVTVSRVFTDSYTGIDLASVPGFMLAQALGTGLAIAAARVFTENKENANV